MNTTLQVTIPNFNRQDSLLATLEKLGAQWHGQFRVLILDNQSQINPEAAIFERIPQAKDWIQVVRQPVQVGVVANITSCFVHSTADWMWLLANDDEISPDAIATIEKAIAQYPDAAFVNFSSNLCSRRTAICAAGLDEFLARLDSHANLNFISTGLYRVERFKAYIATGYHYGYTFSPHLAMLFSLLRDFREQTAVLHPNEICQNRPARDPGERWSRIDFCLGAAALLELEGLAFEQRRLLAKSFGSSGKVHEFLALQLLAECREQSSGAVQSFLLQSIVQRYFYFDRSMSRWLKKKIYPMMFWFPKFSWWLVGFIFSCTGRKQQLETYQQAPRQGGWR